MMRKYVLTGLGVLIGFVTALAGDDVDVSRKATKKRDKPLTSQHNTQPSTQPITKTVSRNSLELSSFMPFVVGTEYVYQVHPRKSKPQSWHLRCIDSATVDSERLGLFSVRQGGKDHSCLAILEIPPTFWFILLPDLSTRKKSQAQIILKKLGPSLREAKDIPDVKANISILGLLRPNPSEKNTILGEFAQLQAMHFGHHPFSKAAVIPKKNPRWLIRGGSVYLQKGIGLLELSTWDQTCHGNGMSLYLVGYHPTKAEWALPVDISKNGQYRHGKWEYKIDLITRSEGKPIRKGTLLSWPYGPKWVLPNSRSLVTPWGLLMKNDGRDNVGWLPIAEKENTK